MNDLTQDLRMAKTLAALDKDRRDRVRILEKNERGGAKKRRKKRAKKEAAAEAAPKPKAKPAKKKAAKPRPEQTPDIENND